MIGYLAPDGTFYETVSFGHSILAEKLCEQFNWHVLGVLDEDTLLEKGFICLRSRDAFKAMWHREEETPILLTEEQIKFLSNVSKEELSAGQMTDISNMLLDDQVNRRFL